MRIRSFGQEEVEISSQEEHKYEPLQARVNYQIYDFASLNNMVIVSLGTWAYDIPSAVVNCSNIVITQSENYKAIKSYYNSYIAEAASSVSANETGMTIEVHGKKKRGTEVASNVVKVCFKDKPLLRPAEKAVSVLQKCGQEGGGQKSRKICGHPL